MWFQKNKTHIQLNNLVKSPSVTDVTNTMYLTLCSKRPCIAETVMYQLERCQQRCVHCKVTASKHKPCTSEPKMLDLQLKPG